MAPRQYDDVFTELKVKALKELAGDRRPKEFAEDVADYWRSISPRPGFNHPLTTTGPYATGAYAASIHVSKRQGRNAKGQFTPSFEVYTHSEIAHFLEYGTNIDNPTSRSPWGRFTPTARYGLAAQTAHHFGGTPG